jgi:hypothetical protein
VADTRVHDGLRSQCEPDEPHQPDDRKGPLGGRHRARRQRQVRGLEGNRSASRTRADVFLSYASANLTPTTKTTLSLADPAPLPSSPARPKPTLYTLLAAFIGLGVALALAFLWDRVDRRMRTAAEVEARFDRPVLGRIPRRGRGERSVTAFRESFRVLRTNLQFATTHGMARSVAITSGQAEEARRLLPASSPSPAPRSA